MRTDKELAKIAEISTRLTSRHPEVSRGTVETVVREVHRDFEGSRVRDFVPLLVERYAGARLSHPDPDGPRVANS